MFNNEKEKDRFEDQEEERKRAETVIKIIVPVTVATIIGCVTYHGYTKGFKDGAMRASSFILETIYTNDKKVFSTVMGMLDAAMAK